MQIRLATAGDLKSCLQLDRSYESDRVWQMNAEVNPDGIEVSFRFTRLPRPVTINRQPDGRWLRQSWERHECFLVAEHQGWVLGYLDMTVQAWHEAGWINQLIVGREYRRHGIAKSLLTAARAWAEQRGLRVLMLETEPKNHPAIQLFQQMGFSFCGYNDQFYDNEDIALFFNCRLR